MQNIEEELQHIKHIIVQYAPDDIYNMDETGLFYNLAPDKTIAQRQIEGAKKDKTRITIGFTCNASGSDRLPPLFIGHAAKPRCFKKKSGDKLGFFYLHNKTAWMTGIFFEIFLRRLNAHVNRKVLLIIDNAPSHIWNESEFPNLQILSLPPNTTSKLQPLDAGIIASFKRHYRRYQLEHAIDLLEASKNPYKVDQLTAMKWVCAAWNKIDQSVIVNCWRHTSLLNPNDCDLNLDVNALQTDVVTFEEEFSVLLNALHIQDPVSANDYIACAEENQPHVILTDAELLAAAQTAEVDEDQESAAAVPFPLLVGLSDQECVQIIAKAAAIVEARLEYQAVEGTIQTLKRVQKEIRWDIAKEKEKNKTQKTIDSCFKKNLGGI
jgi:DDE superfamily endonuclease